MNSLGSVVILIMITHSLETSLKILDTPDGKIHPEPCALVCSGISRHDSDYSWSYVGFGLRIVYKKVDMSGCNFVSEPVITATTRDVYDTNRVTCPAFVTENSGADNFYIISKQPISTEDAERWQCDVHWVATGYNC
jgi:hypothetical protein